MTISSMPGRRHSRCSRLFPSNSARFWALAVVITLGAPIAISAQTPDRSAGSQPTAASGQGTSPPTFATEVVVTPERDSRTRQDVTAASSLLTREQIAGSPATDAGALIALLPGFHALFAAAPGAVPIVSSRGFFGGGEAEYVRVLVDGVPVGDAESGLAEWRTIQAAHIERIEALRGPGSSLYGDTSLGGVVQVFTVRRGGWLDTSAGTFRSAQVGGGATAQVRGLQAFVSGGASRTDGFRSHSGGDSQVVRAGIEGAPTGHVWRVQVTGERTDRDTPGPRSATQLASDRFGSDAAFRFDFNRTARGRIAAIYRHAGSRMSGEATAHGSRRTTDRVGTIFLAPNFPDRAFNAMRTWSGGGSGNLMWSDVFGLRRSQLLIGTDIDHDDLQTAYASATPAGAAGGSIAATSGTRDRLGAFASQSWTPVDPLRLLVGVRWDRIADRFGASASTHAAWSPRAGVNIRLARSGRLNAFAQVARAFKAPTLDQMFDPRPFPIGNGATLHISNAGLRPEHATNIEAGLVHVSKWLQWDLVAYRMTLTDEIDFDVATFRYGNVASSRHSGFELTMQSPPRWRFSPALFVAWTDVSPRSGPYTDRQLKNIPRQLWRPALNIRGPLGVHVGARYMATAGAFVDDENAFVLRPARSLDLRIDRSLRGARFLVDVMNLTDARFEEYGFVLTDRTGRPVPYYYPGAGASARVGMELRFK